MNKFNKSVLGTLNKYECGFYHFGFQDNIFSFRFVKGTRELVINAEYQFNFSKRDLRFRLVEYKAFKLAKEYFITTQIDEIYNVRMGLKSKSVFNLKLNK